MSELVPMQRGLRKRQLLLVAVAGLLASRCTAAQISLSSAIDLALRTDPRVRLAQDDLRHALAVRQEVRDAYLPAATATGGAGYTYGITLTVPTVFTLDAQSLIYSPSQKHYAAASRWELQAAQIGVANAREQVEEEVALTYVAMDLAQQQSESLGVESLHAESLSNVVQQRLNAGLESQLESKLARLTAAQTRLLYLQQQDEVENLRTRLGQMTGLPADALRVEPASIAALDAAPVAPQADAAAPDTLEVIRAREQAEGRRERALADARGPLRPVVTFNAQYARVSPINNVTDYYNLHDRYNIFSFGAIVRFPFLDAAARARQREARADAARAIDEQAPVQFRQVDDRRNLRHALTELSARLEIASLNASIATDQLAITRRLAVSGGDGSAIMNPKDVERSAIAEQQRRVELLDATLQLRRVQINYLRQTGALDAWVQSLRHVAASASAPAETTLPLLP